MSKRKGDPGYAPGWCIHFRNAARHDTCEVGVQYNTWSKFNEPPCFLDNGEPKLGAQFCDQLRVPTPAEIAAHKEWFAARWGKIRIVMVGISSWRKAHKGRSAQEVVECPACKGRLHLSPFRQKNKRQSANPNDKAGRGARWS